MLRSSLRIGALLSMAGAIALTVLSGPAAASHSKTVITCPREGQQGECRIEVVLQEHPGNVTPRGTTKPIANSAPTECSYSTAAKGKVSVPCRDSGSGWWSQSRECYYKQVSEDPAAPVWEGRYPDGAVYDIYCPDVVGFGTSFYRAWMATPPPGFGGPGVSAAQLAVRAVELLPIRGPEIGTVPEPGPDRLGLVGLPTWMWTARLPETVGPVSRTASVPGLSVTATAQMQKIVWEMGNGDRVTCLSPGTVYADRFLDRMSPDCGYRYVEPGEYRVTATTTWQLTWAGGGETGVLTQTRSSSTDLRVGELQVLIQ